MCGQRAISLFMEKVRRLGVQEHAYLCYGTWPEHHNYVVSGESGGGGKDEKSKANNII